MIGRISCPAFTDPAADRLRPLLGFCHLEGSDQPFETQLQTAWVSFGKQMWVAFAGPEGGPTKLVNNRSRSLSSRWDCPFCDGQSGKTFGAGRGFDRAGRVKEPSGCFHQVDGLAAWTLEPPSEVASTRPWLRLSIQACPEGILTQTWRAYT